MLGVERNHLRQPFLPPPFRKQATRIVIVNQYEHNSTYCVTSVSRVTEVLTRTPDLARGWGGNVVKNMLKNGTRGQTAEADPDTMYGAVGRLTIGLERTGPP